MARILLLLLITAITSQSVVGKTVTREEILEGIQAKGCLNKEELKCLGVSVKQCENYTQAVSKTCKDRLPKTLDDTNISDEERTALGNFTNCASQLSQSVMGVSPDKAASCAAK